MVAYTAGMFATDTDSWLPHDLHHSWKFEWYLGTVGPSTDPGSEGYYDPVELDVISGTVTLDESWSPYVQAEIVVSGTGTTVDPRAWGYAVITPSYTQVDGTTRTAAFGWKLYVRRRTVDYVAGTTTLSLSSIEAVVQDWQWTNSASTHTETSSTTCSSAALGFSSLVPGVHLAVTSAAATLGADLVVSVDQPSVWDAMRECADRAGVQIWPAVSSSAFWEFAAPPTAPSSSYATALPKGTDGVVTAWESTENRDSDWYNAVMVTYTAGGTGPTRTSEITTGAGGTDNTAKRALLVQRNTTAPASGDTRVPAALVARAIRSGIEHRITAISAYWLQPRQSVYLPDGTTLALVKRVQFTLPDGLMTVTTRSA